MLARCSQELVGEEMQTSDGGTSRRDSADERRTGRRSAAHARGRLALAAEGRARAGRGGRACRAELVFVGLIGMIDPPRDEAKDAVARAKGAGIRPMMITGDHPITAAVIAAELGIAANGRAVTGAELEKMPDETLDSDGARSVGLCARQPRAQAADREGVAAAGAIVAMTGDGVNDAPALEDRRHRRGDGHYRHRCFQRSGRHGAGRRQLRHHRRGRRGGPRDLLEHPEILALPAVVEHRRSDDDVLWRAAGGVIGLTADGGSGVVLPLLATQILWINLVTDGAPALALGVDPADAGLMNDPPRPRGEGVITRRMWAGIFFVGVIMAAGTLLVLDASLARWPDRRRRRHALCADDGVHDADAVSALQRLQRAFG